MRFALLLLVPLSLAAQESSLTGAVVTISGDYVANAAVETDSGARKYQTQTNDAGVFEFSNLPGGQYTLTIRVPGFKSRTIKSITLLELEKRRLPDVPMDVSLPCRGTSRDLVLLAPGTVFGRLTGTVDPPAAEVEVTLVCRTFSACRSTKTDANGRFSFGMLSAGFFGLNFHRVGFYPENATGYSYEVNTGWESVYAPQLLEPCPNGNCDPKLRPQPPVAICE